MTLKQIIRLFNKLKNKYIKAAQKELKDVDKELSQLVDGQSIRISKEKRACWGKRGALNERSDHLENMLNILNYDHYFSDNQFVCGCCGIGAIEGLDGYSPQEQAIKILGVMKDNELSQVVITDTEKSNAWKATKALAIPGPLTLNFKTKNKVRHWTITPDMIESIFNYKEDGKV